MRWLARFTVGHLFSGHRRPGDFEDWLTRLGASGGYRVDVLNVDLGLGPQWDLRLGPRREAL
eukprot:8369719-Lingulodinium_polyedra.AAC.1